MNAPRGAARKSMVFPEEKNRADGILPDGDKEALRDDAGIFRIGRDLWSEADLFQLHVDLFYASFEALSNLNQDNVCEKEDILDWIFEPDVRTHWVNGQKKERFSLDVPFSFMRCCKLLGYQPDLIRAGLEERVQDRQVSWQGFGMK
ncbi:MAG: hypothetical protein KGQ58_09085 [Proteobacteria bacterium]|nr:hypothetical protein [Pseudomonadota bacterium]